MKHKHWNFLSLFSLFFFFCFLSCSHPNFFVRESEPFVLTSINIQDRNGFSEVISNRDRLDRYQEVDFLQPQPYQKVLRIYNRDPQGNSRAFINSYHPNGQPKQYLEIVNNRAYGVYQEWHPNGVLKIQARVIGGEPDIDTISEKTWLFNGPTRAWDEEGCLLAEIPYCNGELEGVSVYFHTNGAIWKSIPFRKGKMEGIFTTYLNDGSLLQTAEYASNVKQGALKRYWPDGSLSSDESYNKDLLLLGTYYDRTGNVICSIQEGNGYRALFGKVSINELQEYRNGIPEGEVKAFNEEGALIKLYHVRNGLKDGEEIEYFSKTEARENTPKLSIGWVEGKIQGTVKTWYPNGVQESQREMVQNVKNGMLTAWYLDGTLMLIEEYEQDKLMNGEYFLPGEIFPVSEIKLGKGIATIFDAKGNFIRKVSYYKSKPQNE